MYCTTMVAIMLQNTSLNTLDTPYKYFFPKLYSLVYYIKDRTMHTHVTAMERDVVYCSTSATLLILCILRK